MPRAVKVVLLLNTVIINWIAALILWLHGLLLSCRSSFANQGEICLCTSRVYVQKGIYDQFLEKFVEQTRYLSLRLFHSFALVILTAHDFCIII